MLALKLWKVRFCNYGLVRWEIYFNPLFEQTNEPTSGKVFFDDHDITQKQTKNYWKPDVQK
jgi:hypothetical protein